MSLLDSILRYVGLIRFSDYKTDLTDAHQRASNATTNFWLEKRKLKDLQAAHDKLLASVKELGNQ